MFSHLFTVYAVSITPGACIMKTSVRWKTYSTHVEGVTLPSYPLVSRSCCAPHTHALHCPLSRLRLCHATTVQAEGLVLNRCGDQCAQVLQNCTTTLRYRAPAMNTTDAQHQLIEEFGRVGMRQRLPAKPRKRTVAVCPDREAASIGRGCAGRQASGLLPLK